MGTLFKLGIAYLLAPTFAVAVAWLVAAAFGVTMVGAIVVSAVAFGLALAFAVGKAVCRPMKSRLSPVRRRQPRPAAWYQWR
jgi:uncharacterized membrane protein YraQ (UPF0718 family)